MLFTIRYKFTIDLNSKYLSTIIQYMCTKLHTLKSTQRVPILR